MKKVILLFICAVLFSCNTKNEAPIEMESFKSVPEASKSIQHEHEHAVIDASLDTLPVAEKEKIMAKAYFANTVCSCGSVCCTSCTSNGNPYQCAVTRFNACSVCGHGKGSHGPG